MKRIEEETWQDRLAASVWIPRGPRRVDTDHGGRVA